jgi:hypothetical protein
LVLESGEWRRQRRSGEERPSDFFFEHGWSQRTEKLSLLIVGGVTHYNEDQQKVRKYRQALTICTEDPKINQSKAIGSSSFSTESTQRSTVNRLIAGDKTTWGGAAGARCAGAVGTPYWHGNLEVVHLLVSPPRRNRSAQPRWEWSPFDHQR